MNWSRGDILASTRERSAAAVSVFLLMAGCGGAPTVPNPAGASGDPAAGTNSPPQITGVAAANVAAGGSYLFTPTATDPNGDSLTFTILNKPSWATFSVSTGRLQGTPSASNAGTYSGIVIRVSDGQATAELPAFTITVAGAASGSAMLSWSPPAQNTDGTALTDLAGYWVYYGNSAESLQRRLQIADPTAATRTISGLSSGTWYFAVTAYNQMGLESGFSNLGSKVIP